MADIKFDIAVTGVEQLKQAAQSFDRLGTVSSKLSKAYGPLGAQTNRVIREQNRLQSVLRKLIRAYKDGTITTDQYVAAMKEEKRVSQEKVLRDQKLIDQARKRQKAINAENKDLARLTRAFRSDIVAKKEYLRVQRDIRKAERLGLITQQQMQVELAKTAKEFDEFSRGVANAGNQFSRFNLAAYKKLQGARRIGSIELQQFGYQIGDFAVQVQSGTSALVAFGQQASQLAGVFGARGALLGAGIAIVSALASSFTRAKTEAKEANEELEKMVKNLEEVAKRSRSGLGSEQQKIADKSVETDVKLQEAKKKLDELLTSLKEIQETGQYISRSGGSMFNIEAILALPKAIKIRGITKDIKELREEIDRLSKLQQRTGSAIAGSQAEVDLGVFGGIGEDVDDVIRRINRRRLEAEEAIEAKRQEIGNLEEEQIAAFGESRKNNIEQETAERKRLLDLEAAMVAKILSKRRAEFARREAELEEAASTEKSEIQKRREAAEIARARKQFAALEKDRDAAYVVGYKKRVKAEQEAEKERLKALEKQAEAERKLFEENLAYEQNQLLEASRELGEEAVKLGARLGISFAEALKFIQQAKAEAAFDLDVFGGAGAFNPTTPKDKDADKDRDRLNEYIEELTNRIDKENQLLGLFDLERDLKEQQIEAQQEYGDVASKAQMAAIDGHLAEIQAIEEKQRVLEEQRQMILDYNTFMKQSFEDTFMSVIDGTSDLKSAMKKLVSDLISEFMRMMVIRPLMNSIFGGGGPTSSPFFSIFGLANGGVMNKGNLVPFAQGGVVGGPTTFPMYGGKTGLMGEAGPEAIMPLKRGAGGRLGVDASGSGGGTIVINHSFNFTANGDDSVKRIIAQSMPDITEATKASVLDARKRGGQFRRVFS